MSDVTQILSAIEQGDPSAAELLLPLTTSCASWHRIHLTLWGRAHPVDGWMEWMRGPENTARE